jgi:hypothetical protein
MYIYEKIWVVVFSVVTRGSLVTMVSEQSIASIFRGRSFLLNINKIFINTYIENYNTVVSLLTIISGSTKTIVN